MLFSRHRYCANVRVLSLYCLFFCYFKCVIVLFVLTTWGRDTLTSCLLYSWCQRYCVYVRVTSLNFIVFSFFGIFQVWNCFVWFNNIRWRHFEFLVNYKCRLVEVAMSHYVTVGNTLELELKKKKKNVDVYFFNVFFSSSKVLRTVT